jgi:hypothetical protein
MPPFDVDLNDQPPESGDLYPIDWDDIGEYDGLAHQLDYNMVWDDGTQGKSTKIFVLPSVSSVHEFISVLQHLAIKELKLMLMECSYQPPKLMVCKLHQQMEVPTMVCKLQVWCAVGLSTVPVVVSFAF